MISYKEYEQDLISIGYFKVEDEIFKNRLGMIFHAVEIEQIRLGDIHNSFSLLPFGIDGVVTKEKCFYKCKYLSLRREEYDPEMMGYCGLMDGRFVGSISDICNHECECVAKGVTKFE